MLLGRTANTDITVNDHSVSKLHLELYKVPGADWLIQDCDARNGTMTNDSVLSPDKTLSFRARTSSK